MVGKSCMYRVEERVNKRRLQSNASSKFRLIRRLSLRSKTLERQEEVCLVCEYLGNERRGNWEMVEIGRRLCFFGGFIVLDE